MCGDYCLVRTWSGVGISNLPGKPLVLNSSDLSIAAEIDCPVGAAIGMEAMPSGQGQRIFVSAGLGKIRCYQFT